MEVTKITFQANEQELVKTGGVDVFASDTVSYIEAEFTLGTNWQGYDSVRAMWKFGSEVIATVLDYQGKCIVPWEVLTKRGELKVNLVGSISENDVLTDRLTTFPILALVISKIAQVEGDNSTPPTASEYEQFVEDVHDDADRAEQAMLDAQTAQGLAEDAQASAETAQGLAEQARDDAQTAQGKAETAQRGAETAEIGATAQALKSEGYATGRQNGQYVPSTSPYYHDNALYYKDRAEQAEQSILDLTATASVDNTVGTPSVVVTVTEGETKNMDFAFHNLKGEKGNVNFASFYVDFSDMSLHMVTDDEYTGANFYLDKNELVVRI